MGASEAIHCEAGSILTGNYTTYHLGATTMCVIMNEYLALDHVFDWANACCS